jgi:transposase InsO family protein
MGTAMRRQAGYTSRHAAAVPVGVGTTFAYEGETVTIVKMATTGHGNEVLVEDRGGKRRYQLSLRELLASGSASIITVDDGPRADDDIDLAGVVLSNLSDRQLAEVGEKADHVREVLTGYRSGCAETARPGEPRPQYAPVLPLACRYDAKAKELALSDRTIRRWAAAYRDYGEAGLATLTCTDPMGQADPRWLATAAEIMIENADLSRPNKKNIILQTRARLDLTYGPGIVASPSQATAYRRLQQLDRRVPTFTGSRARNRDVAARVDREYGQLRANRPGEFMVMDTNSLDVYALDPVTLRCVKVELTAAMDAYTRCVVGLRVTPTTKSLDVAATLFQAFRPLPAPAHWPDYAVWPEHGIPRAVFPDVDGLEGRATATAHPALVPETIVIDHGRPFKSQHINSVCQRMGISIQPARLRTASDKGILERFFLTLRLDLLQYLPGYKGPDVYSRGVSPESEAMLYLDEIEQLIRQWIATVYHHRAHDSLFDPSVPGHRLSPAQMFQHGVERAGYIEAPRDPDLAFEFLRPVPRRIGHDGVSVNGRMYNGPGLNGLRETDSPNLGEAQRRWHIHVNPDDITRVYLRRPDTRKWCTLLWRDAPSDLPMTEDGVTYARRLAAVRGTSTEPDAALARMLEEWGFGMGRSTVERRIALRLAKQRAELLGEFATEDESDARVFIADCRKALAAQVVEVPQRRESQAFEDDVDAFVAEDAADDDEETDDDEYYADAFEDS